MLCQIMYCLCCNKLTAQPGAAGQDAPGLRHPLVVRDGVRWTCKLSVSLPVNRHKPSVDVLFRSVSEKVGPNGLGLILTGMVKDGAQGLKDMLEAGVHAIPLA